MAASESGFPMFTDGDVHIIVTGLHQFKLHKEVLNNKSSFFRKLLTEESGVVLSKYAIKKGTKIRWRLRLDQGYDDSDIGRLILVPLDKDGCSTDGFAVPFDLGNGITVDPIGENFGIVLGAIYGKPIVLGDFQNNSFTDMLEAAYRIQRIAYELDVVDVLTHPIEANLLSHGSLLYCSIANSPGRWLEFAVSMKSRLIFREAVIHAVGQYNTRAIQHLVTLRPDTPTPPWTQLLTTKYKKLQTDLKSAQMSILTYYPANLQRDLTIGLVDRDRIGRNSYQNDIFGWMAINAYRHWISQNLIGDYTHHAKDMGFEFFDMVAKGEDAYLNHSDLEGFYRLFPMTRKEETVVETAIGQLKAHCRQFATPFLVNNTQLDKRAYPSPFFACVEVSHEDYDAMMG